MKQWFRRKVLGTIPVWFILLTVAVVVVAGAFLWSISFDTEITAESAPEATIGTAVCTITAGKGTVDTCLRSGQDFSLVLSGVDNDTVVNISFMHTSSSGQQTLHFTPPGSLPSAVGSLTCTSDASGTPASCEGTIVEDGVQMEIDIDFDLSNITGLETVSDLDFQYSAENN